MGLFDMFKKKEPVRFEEIDSIDKAKKACRNHDLERMYILSPIFGGMKDESNILYVPVGINKIKEGYDAVLADLVEQGKAKSFNCNPQYRGRSIVPCKITIVSSNGSEEVFRETINVW